MELNRPEFAVLLPTVAARKQLQEEKKQEIFHAAFFKEKILLKQGKPKKKTKKKTKNKNKPKTKIKYQLESQGSNVCTRVRFF